MRQLLSALEFKNLVRDGKSAGEAVYRLATDAPTEVEGQSRTLRFVFSDGSIDRAGDTIAADGWELENFQKNPVALWAHDSRNPPIGRAHNVHVSKKRLVGDIEFAPVETYEFADTIYRLIKGEYIRAVSVGFIPIEWKYVDEPDLRFAIDFLKQELLEISPCPVPCNPNALQEARAKGIDTRPLVMWAEKTLDEGGFVTINRDDLNALRLAAKELASRAAPPAVETIEKSGRVLSEKNRKSLQEAMEHHTATAKCMKDVLDSAAEEPNDADDPPEAVAPPEETEAAKRQRDAKQFLATISL